MGNKKSSISNKEELIEEEGYAVLPCSSKWLLQINKESPPSTRWSRIKNILETHPPIDDLKGLELLYAKLHNFQEVEKALTSSSPSRKTLFPGLRQWIDQDFTQEEREQFFSIILPYIRRKALELEKHFPSSSPSPFRLRLLVSSPPSSSPSSSLTEKTEETHSPSSSSYASWNTVRLSRAQVASLLSNAFFSLFPLSQNYKKESFPEPNWDKMFTVADIPSQLAKFRHFIHYFYRIYQEEEQTFSSEKAEETSSSSSSPSSSPSPLDKQEIVFKRLRTTPQTSSSLLTSTTPLRSFQVFRKGGIENSQGAIQVDFANKYIGGGVLHSGCVQEEIRFSCNTELLVSLLFTETLKDHEALFVTGSQQYSRYEGYGRKWRFGGDYREKSPKDSSGNFITPIVAMDAIQYGTGSNGSINSIQFQEKWMLRDINKALAAFQDPGDSLVPPGYSIATGNWGCGVFGGVVELKALEQWIAASMNGFDLLYFSFGDPAAKSLAKLTQDLREKEVTVGQLWRVMLDYQTLSGNKSGNELFEFVRRKLLE